MRVIEKVGAEMKGIAIVSAGGIRGSRDGNALFGRDSRTGELADEPAIGDMVVEDDGITLATTRAETAEPGPDRSDRKWSQNRCAGHLIKYLIAFVHNLNV